MQATSSGERGLKPELYISLLAFVFFLAFSLLGTVRVFCFELSFPLLYFHISPSHASDFISLPPSLPSFLPPPHVNNSNNADPPPLARDCQNAYPLLILFNDVNCCSTVRRQGVKEGGREGGQEAPHVNSSNRADPPPLALDCKNAYPLLIRFNDVNCCSNVCLPGPPNKSLISSSSARRTLVSNLGAFTLNIF